MIKIHREGIIIVIYSLLVLLSMLLVAVFFLPLYLSIPVGTALVVLMILITRFFRIPRRNIVTDPDHITAPADGKIVAIQNVYEPEILENKCIQVSIFMSIYNVHINWFPITGMVKSFKYHPGKYLVARHPKSSSLNERTSVVMVGEHVEIMVRQIAGYVARRIVCYARENETVSQEDQLGFIKFGSRLDLFIPEESEILVKEGEKTKGGITRIARIK